MITSLQNFFLKHNKWLFGGLLVIIIVTFVLTIGPQSFFGSRGDQRQRSLNFYGYNLSSESDQRAMVYSAEISAVMHPELQLNRDQLTDYAYLRVTALGMAEQLGIPSPTKEELSDYVSTLMIFVDPQTGEFSPESYNRIIEAMQGSGRYDRDAIGTVLREDYRIDQVRKALGGPDYSLPFETRQDFISRSTTYEVSLARLNYESFNPEIELSEEDLLQFFNENPGRYEIPETLSTTAVLFKAEAYLEEVQDPSPEELAAYFETNRMRYEAAREEPAEGEPALPELTLDDVRETALKDWKTQQARKIAARKGEQFSLRLWQNKIALDSPEFETALKEFGARTRDLPAYSRNQPPRLPDVPVSVLNSMWIYVNNPSRYFSDIAQIADGAVVVVKRGLTEARMPSLDEVREQVAADYRASEKRRLFAARGQEIRGIFESRLGSESFTDVAADLGLEVEELEPFDGISVPQELRANSIWDQAMYLDQGEVTPMIIAGDQGTFAYISGKDVPEIDKDSEEFQEFVARRSTGMSDAMGWARLQEIKDASLAALMGTPDQPAAE